MQQGNGANLSHARNLYVHRVMPVILRRGIFLVGKILYNINNILNGWMDMWNLGTYPKHWDPKVAQH